MCLMVAKTLPKGVTMVMQKRADDKYILFYDPDATHEPAVLAMYDGMKQKIDSKTIVRI